LAILLPLQSTLSPMVQMALHPSSFLIAMTPLRPVGGDAAVRDRGFALHLQ